VGFGAEAGDVPAAHAGRLAAQYDPLKLDGPGESDAARWRAEVAGLESEADRLEAEVSRRSAPFRAQTQPVSIEAVQRALPPGSALVELVSYKPYNIAPGKSAGGGARFGPARYAAYVLLPEGEPLFADLGDAASIDERVARLRDRLKSPASGDVKSAARDLDESVMRPVRRLLGKNRRVFISPDGTLNLVPFAALVDEHGSYLVEHYAISYLTSGRDLLRLQVEGESRQPPLIFADPLFTPRTEASACEGEAARSATRSVDLRDAVFTPLKGTAEEAEAIRGVLKVAPLTGAGASEAALKNAAGPSILHVATHGFFLADEKSDATDSVRGLKLVSDGDARRGQQSFAAENPLLRSGLALAGANGRRGGGGEDGILTALEAAGLDLWGTKLVVLSACETGVGEVRNGEGVYGLRRALVLAGSETQVMSLWQVSDAATRDLMTDYYRRLAAGEGRADALREVQLSMLGAARTPPGAGRRTRGPKTARANAGFSHPFFWASFIQSGDWRGLGRYACASCAK
jgi:CHAT domain-containing protein